MPDRILQLPSIFKKNLKEKKGKFFKTLFIAFVSPLIPLDHACSKGTEIEIN